MIIADDMGEWAMNCGENDEIITPNIDYLANSGIRFQNFFCASPVCSPARASIYTGTIPSSHGVHDWISNGNMPQKDKGGAEIGAVRYIEHLTAFTELLKENGYGCALSGKWHLGDSLHSQKGFDKWYTIGSGGCDYFKPDIIDNGKYETKYEYVSDLITANALKSIEDFAGKKPFFLSVNYTAPHSPWNKSQQKKYIWKKYRRDSFKSLPKPEKLNPLLTQSAPYAKSAFMHKRLLRGYFSAITAMDEGIGKIIDKLKSRGIYKNTIIIFTGDNGMNMGHHGLYGKGNATYPPNMFDTSVKVPFILSWPKQIKKSGVNKNLYSHCDIMPTLIDLLNLKGAVKQKLPGKSFADLFFGKEAAQNKSIIIFSEYGESKMIRNENYKLIARSDAFFDEFYDLKNDPGETNNLINDPAFKETADKMRGKLNDFLKEYGENKIDSNGILTADVLLSSPSSAAGFVGGASLSGNAHWKDADGKTLRELLETD